MIEKKMKPALYRKRILRQTDVFVTDVERMMAD